MNRKVVIGSAVALVVLAAIFGSSGEDGGEEATPAPEVTATQQQETPQQETQAYPAAPDELVAFICAGSTDNWGPSLENVTASAAVPVPNTNGAYYVALAWTPPGEDDQLVGVWDVSSLTSDTGVYNVRAVDGFAKQFTEFRESTRSITDAGAEAAKDAVS